ncbi:MAG: CDP-alcohol phosphatidyltransferase family protein [Acidimicrobiales bacterium]
MTATDPAHPRVAWAIHVFTAIGIIAGFLALVSALDGSPRMSLTWMTVAMVIDGLDGPIARRYEISAVLPHIDGHVGDLIIDYVTTVIAPAFFIHEFDLLPKRFDLIGVSLMMLTALYLFSNTHIQSEDNYFNGFPAMWNLVVNVMFVLQSPKVANMIIVIVMSVFTVVPVKFVHPIRVRDFRRTTITVLVLWLAALLYLTWIIDDRTRGCDRSCLPVDARIAQGMVYFGALWIVGVGVWRTFRGDPTPTDSRPIDPAAAS